MTKGCQICTALTDTSTYLMMTKYWVVILANDQAYLGRCFITQRQHKGSLSSLTNEEWIDFSNIVKRLENSCTQAFGANPFNWACLMNNSYQAKPYNPHVHWHFRPRYSRDVVIDSHTFSDPEYGNHYNQTRRDIVPASLLKEITRKLKEYL